MWIIEAHYDDKKDEFQIWSLNKIIWENHFNNPVLHKKIKDYLRNQHETKLFIMRIKCSGLKIYSS